MIYVYKLEMNSITQDAKHIVASAFRHPPPIVHSEEVDSAVSTLCHTVLTPEECLPVIQRAFQNSDVKDRVCGEFASTKPMSLPLLQPLCPNLPPHIQMLHQSPQHALVEIDDSPLLNVKPMVLGALVIALLACVMACIISGYARAMHKSVTATQNITPYRTSRMTSK